MNTPIRRTLPAIAMSSLMLAFAGSASAADGLTQRLVTGVGQVIAAQGNAALVHIREELDRSIGQTIRPLLPTDTVNAPDARAEDAELRVGQLSRS